MAGKPHMLSAPILEGVAYWPGRAALFLIFVRTYFKCFFLVFLFFFLATLTALDSRRRWTTKSKVNLLTNTTLFYLVRTGQGVIHRHLGTLALCKTKNILTTVW